MKATFGFLDESGFSERPLVCRTWAPRGATPVIRTPGHWNVRTAIGLIRCAPDGTNPRLYLHLLPRPVKADTFIRFLRHLRRQVPGRMILIMDRLAVHRAKTVTAYLATQTHWLEVAWLPAYAPELNPIEYCWSASKRKDLGNLTPDSMTELDHRIRRSFQRIRRRPDLLKGFLKASSLFPKVC